MQDVMGSNLVFDNLGLGQGDDILFETSKMGA